MTKIELAKNAVKIVVGAGTATIVKAIISNNVQPDDLTTKVTTTVGSLVLGSMVADLATRYTDAKIDSLTTWYNDNVKK
jgi:hypothetical protein